MVCVFVYYFKVFNFQIGHRSDFNRKFSICWNRAGHQFQRVEIGSVANFGNGNWKSKSAFNRIQWDISSLGNPASFGNAATNKSTNSCSTHPFSTLTTLVIKKSRSLSGLPPLLLYQDIHWCLHQITVYILYVLQISRVLEGKLFCDAS